MSLYLRKRKRFLKKILVGLSLFLLGSTALVFFSFVFSRWVPLPTFGQPVFAVLVMSLVSILAYKPLDIAFTQFFRHFLFKKKSYTHMTLLALAEELALVLDLQELANLVVNTFGEVLRLKTVALLTAGRKAAEYEIASAYGWKVSDSKKVTLTKDSPLLEIIRTHGPHVLVRDRVVRTLSWQEASRLEQDFNTLQASWVVPLFVKEEFVGLVAFASTRPENIFDEADFQFFREFALSAAKSVRNAVKVAELRHANEELGDRQSRSVQATKIVALSQLATGIAHEIHNPLTIISGKAQVLLLQKDRHRYDEKVEEVLKTIVKQTKRAADITRKLLMFSQSSGAPSEALRLEQVLADTIALVSYQISLEGMEITRVVSDPGPPPFYGNVHELREVFLNLILNAVQSVGARGKIQCEIKDRPKERLTEIQISDTGKGIAPEHIDKLFNPFFTTRQGAVGLGLFVTKQIVHHYGGSIRVESRVGEGSLFIVHLPYSEDPSCATFLRREENEEHARSGR